MKKEKDYMLTVFKQIIGLRSIALLLTMLILYPVSTSGQANSPAPTVETRELKPFEIVYVSRGINVTLVRGNNPKAEIHITNAQPSEVIIEQKGLVLEIRMRARINTNVAVNVYLYHQDIRKLAAFTGASVFSEEEIKTGEIILESGTDGHIQLEVDANRLVVNASASRIEVKGRARSTDITASAGGRFIGANLKSESSEVRANTGANAQVWVTGNLVARASTGARIEYKGAPPKVEVHTTTGGRVDIQ